MTCTLSTLAARVLALVTTAAAVTVFAVSTAQAQSIYRSVGPDGKVSFSDRAPAAEARPALQEPAAVARTSYQEASLLALPYALRQTALRFPVTLYTSAACGPCATARAMLEGRGVPFIERTVKSNEDIEALQRLSNSTNLPFATVGSQQLSGFSDAEWKQYLDAAGYPKQSQLPANYQRPAVTPLVRAQRAETAQPPASKDKTAVPSQQPKPLRPQSSGPTESNPAGIRF